MIDLHCHIVPGIDDGADSWETAVEMGRLAFQGGTAVLTATCHFNHPSAPFCGGSLRFWERYRKKRKRLEHMLREEGISLILAEGAEILAGEEICSMKDSSFLPSLNGTRYLLVEVRPDVSAFFIYRVLDRLLEKGYLPVLAHPERYRCAQAVHSHIYEWYKMGALIQINKGSLFGAFGIRAQKTADAILRHRLAAAAASDAHSSLRRTPEMNGLYQLLSRKYGPACPALLLEENPRRILKGENVIWENPLPFYGPDFE